MAIGTPGNVITPFGSGTDGTVYTTASMTPGASRKIYLCVSGGAGTAGNNVKPVITGTLGLTWTEIITGANTANNLRGTVWEAVTTGSPPTGTIVATFSATQSSCQIHVFEVPSTNLAVNAVQSGSFVTALTDNPAVTLPSAIGSGNATFGFAVWNSTSILPVGSNYTALGDAPSAITPTIRTHTEYLIAGTTVVDWTTTSNVEKVIFAWEVADAASNPGAFFAVL